MDTAESLVLKVRFELQKRVSFHSIGYFWLHVSIDVFILGYLNAAFLATKSGGVNEVTDPIVFDVTPVNYGENFDNTTGIYTVPMNGLYEFNVQIYCVLNNGHLCVYYISVDGTLMTDTPSTVVEIVDESVSLTTSVILELSEGQQISISPSTARYNIAGTLNGMGCWFAGQLLMAY